MTMESYTLSDKTIEAIGEDLIQQYLNNDGWLFELLDAVSDVMIGEEPGATSLFNKHSETLDIRVQVKVYIQTRFEKMIRDGNELTTFRF